MRNYMLNSIAAIEMAMIILVVDGIKKTTFMSVQRPHVEYINPKFYTFFNISMRRSSRNDPRYFYETHFDILVPMDNKLMMHFYFYEFLTNEYKPSFVEMHIKWCDLIEKNMFLGTDIRQGNLMKPCPHPPGIYRIYNLSIPFSGIPKAFPFNKGRIYLNKTWSSNSKSASEWVGLIYADMEIKLWNKINK